MTKLLEEKYKIQTIGMFIEALEICIGSEFEVNFSTSEMYDMLTEVVGVEVDYNHLGTLVSMEYILDQFDSNGDVTIEVWKLQNIPPYAWFAAITKLREVWQMTPDPDAWCVLVTD